MNSIDKLTELFSKFPGIGPRQAKRFVYFLLSRNGNFLADLSRSLSELKNEILICSSCRRFFHKDASSSEICPICANINRTKEILMVVSRDVDLESVEKTHLFNGLYFVLGGSVPILEKNPDARIRSKELLALVKERGKKGLKEIILAMNLNPEGENTGEYLQNILAPLAKEHTIKISLLGRGLSTGTELEYSDSETLKSALEHRSKIA